MYTGNVERLKKIKRRIVTGGMALLIGMTCICGIYSAFSGKGDGEGNERIRESVNGWLQGQLLKTYMPVFAFVEGETGIAGPKEAAGIGKLLGVAVSSQLPLYGYSEKQAEEGVSTEDEDTYDMLVRQEGTDEERKEVEDGSLEYDDDALHIDGDLERAMMEENGIHSENGEDAEEEKNRENEGEGQTEAAERDGDGFQKAAKKNYEYDWAGLTDYEDIVSAFYAIDKTTSITDEQLNLENLLGRDMSIKGSADEPQILIYHTHSQEAFADSVPGDTSTTIVGAGERLSQLLRDEYGFNVMHHTGEYDVEARDYAYSNSLPAIEQLLAENPTIEVVIDLHRDAVAEGKKLMVNLQGRPTAQFMFFNGLSRTRQKGDISYLENPYINDNLAFSFQAQVTCNEYYPGVARRIYLKAYRYNMHLRAKTMLIELGAQTNTVEEIMNACEPLAHVIAKVLSGEPGDQARDAAGISKKEQ